MSTKPLQYEIKELFQKRVDQLMVQERYFSDQPVWELSRRALIKLSNRFDRKAFAAIEGDVMLSLAIELENQDLNLSKIKYWLEVLEAL